MPHSWGINRRQVAAPAAALALLVLAGCTGATVGSETPSSAAAAPGDSGVTSTTVSGEPSDAPLPTDFPTADAAFLASLTGLSQSAADDYVAKPFQSEELIARLRALIRRASGNASSELTAGDIRLDTRSGKVTKATAG